MFHITEKTLITQGVQTRGGVAIVVKIKGPIEIIHCQNKEEYISNGGSKGSIGIYRNNIISFYTADLKVFIHEATHAIVFNIFQNTGLPFGSDDLKNKEYYEACIAEVLQRSAQKLGVGNKNFTNNIEFIEFIKNNSILDLVFVTFIPLQDIPKKNLRDIERKYFDGQVVFKQKNHTEIVEEKLKKELLFLKLSLNDLWII